MAESFAINPRIAKPGVFCDSGIDLNTSNCASKVVAAAAARLAGASIESATATTVKIDNRISCSFSGMECIWPQYAPANIRRQWENVLIVASQAAPDLAGNVEQARQMIVRRACVRVGFSAADKRLARSFHARGVPLPQIERAVWLGCLRKYIAPLNGWTPMPIARHPLLLLHRRGRGQDRIR
ncbi:MAG: hypothetical protein ABI165_17535 [Bryobacteraceae bacterium]